MKNCCFCINLRTATLFLALVGTLTHFYSGLTLTALSDSFQDFDKGTVYGLTLYSYLSGFACLAGTVGVLKNNVKKLQIFNVYYWVDFAVHTLFAVGSSVMLFTLHTDICKEIIQDDSVDLDMESCEQLYIQSAWIITFAMAANMLLKLHFAFAIHNYTLQIQQDKEQLMDDQEIFTQYVPVPTMNTNVDEKQVIYVAGKEFIPDDKKASQ
ncbi:unnamed protein product [Cunninghamella blakesleeana]